MQIVAKVEVKVKVQAKAASLMLNPEDPQLQLQAPNQRVKRNQPQILRHHLQLKSEG